MSTHRIHPSHKPQYDTIAHEYAAGTLAMEAKTRRHFYSLLPDLRGTHVLDAGCGGGDDALYYARKGAQVSGIDISRKQVTLARERVPDGTFKVGTIEDLPFGEDFDHVMSFYALQNAKDVPQAMREMLRVVRPGGLVTILTKHPIRNMIESSVNDGNHDYFARRDSTSYIFNGKIKLTEPAHTMMDYFTPSVLREARLTKFEEHCDFPASAQLMGLKYPTYMIMQLKKPDVAGADEWLATHMVLHALTSLSNAGRRRK